MADAVIFDWYGTLAEWEHAGVSNCATVLSALGYDPDIGVIDADHARWDGVEHRAYSTSREAYVAWTRRRLQQLVHDCGVVDADANHVVEELVNSDYGTRMVAYPDAIPTLRALRDDGIALAVCSNWGWELDSFLEATGVKGFVDVAVTSARAGFRKPHPGIYEVVLQSIGVEAADTVFVGDSWGPDVLGPLDMGMAAVHIVRDASRPSPELLPRTHRVTALDQLLSWRSSDRAESIPPPRHGGPVHLTARSQHVELAAWRGRVEAVFDRDAPCPPELLDAISGMEATVRLQLIEQKAQPTR